MFIANDVAPFPPLGGEVETVSERQTHTSYLRLIITFGLSLAVSELLAFVCGQKNDVMPISPLGGVTGQISRRILKGSTRLPIRDLL